MKKQKQTILLIFLIFLLFAINYSFLDSMVGNFLSDSKTIEIDRVIDGDTIESNGTSIRLLGVNTPERGELYYSESKDFLEGIVLNKTARLEFGKGKYDRYGRLLAYIFFNEENINLKLVEQGYGNFYFPSGKDNKYDQFKDAWEMCIKNNINLCERSKEICADCIELKDFNYKDQEIVLHNSCDFSCDLTNWEIKDEGRKKFVFPEFILQSKSQVKILVGEGADNHENLFWKNEDYVFTTTGDTMFLRDSNGKLILWETY